MSADPIHASCRPHVIILRVILQLEQSGPQGDPRLLVVFHMSCLSGRWRVAR